MTLTLGNLRDALQDVRRDVLSSADPFVEHFRKMLVRLGWYDELVDEELVELLVHRQPLLGVERDAAVADKAPDRLRIR